VVFVLVVEFYYLLLVASPAYGVFHASLKATCEGDERKCVQNLIATASVQLKPNDTFNFTGFSCAKNMSMENNDPKTPFEETEAGKAIASIAADIQSVKEKVETSFEQIPDRTADPSPKGQTTPVTDPSSDGKQAQAAQHPTNRDQPVAQDQTKPDPATAQDPTKVDPVVAQEMDKLKQQAQAADDDLRERLTEDVLETERAEGELMDEPKTAAEEETRKTELAQMETPEIKDASTAALASFNKISAMASKFGKTSIASNFQKTRVIRLPSVATASAHTGGYKNSKDIKGGWAR